MRFSKVGLTGGIAAGKSSVAECWRTRGATIIDSDLLAHAALAPATPTYRQVVAVFGEEILHADGTVNRRRLGDIVFNDAARRQALNDIIHPIVRQQWADQLTATSGLRVVVIPLLYEIGAAGEFDAVVVVGCSEATQLARLTAKGLSLAQARARILAQWPLPQKMERGDFVIWNDGSRHILERQAEIIWNHFTEN